MDYTAEDKEDKKYKKSYGRKEFRKDVAEAVKPELENLKKAKTMKAKPKAQSKVVKKRRQSNVYAGWGVTQLRKHLNDKKKALLIKSGFPGGTIPRSKQEMINLCKKLKRKRW